MERTYFNTSKVINTFGRFLENFIAVLAVSAIIALVIGFWIGVGCLVSFINEPLSVCVGAFGIGATFIAWIITVL